MDYRISIDREKEAAFLQFLRALQSLGVITDYERTIDREEEEYSRNQVEEAANRYRDLVD